MRATILIASSTLALVACSGSAGTGPVEIALSPWTAEDSASEVAIQTASHSGEEQAKDLVKAVVTVNEIDLFVPGSGWVPIMTQPRVVDLLALDGKSLATLGVLQLPVGKACKLRLVLATGNAFVVLKNGNSQPLDLPDSGMVTVTGDLKLEPCATGSIIVDFDPKITVDSHSGMQAYHLRCRAHAKTEKMHGACNPGSPDAGTTADAGGGSCGGVVCAPGEVCSNGMCKADPCAGVVCAPGEVCTNGVCGNPDPCAGVVCQPGTTCHNGTCMPNATPDMGGGHSDMAGGHSDMAGGCHKP